MHPFDDLSITYDSEADYTEQRNRVNGKFDSSEATVTWVGRFAGSFEDLESTGGSKFGRYWITFAGAIDRESSDTLMTTGNSPTWKTNPFLVGTATAAAGDSTTTCITIKNAASLKSGLGNVIYGLATLAIAIPISL